MKFNAARQGEDHGTTIDTDSLSTAQRLASALLEADCAPGQTIRLAQLGEATPEWGEGGVLDGVWYKPPARWSR